MKRKRKRKRIDPRQLPLPSPDGDTSPELEMNPVDIPPPFKSQPDLIRFLQNILCVKPRGHSDKKTPELNPEFFLWPSTDAPTGGSRVADGNWPEKGLLGYLGYAVGEKGKLKAHRRVILTRVFEMKIIPNLVSPAYIREWGEACSSARLEKMADSIAAFCRNAKRRRYAWMKRAIESYEEDLAWLKKKYYDGGFDKKFIWPTI